MADKEDLNVGDLVWAQMKSYPPWPARIALPQEGLAKEKKGHHCVKFFGTNDHAWIPEDKVFVHSEEMLESMTKKKKSTALSKAIIEIIDESKKSPKKESPVFVTKDPLITKKADIVEKDAVIAKKPETPKKKKKHITQQSLIDKKQRKSKKRAASISVGDSDKEIKIKAFKITDKSQDSKKLQTYSNVSFSILQKSKYVERPPTPPLDIKNVRESLLMKDVKPTKKKIGFLGLGPIGRGIVKNLLNSGHNVTVWNQTPVYEEFIEAGAQVATTPEDVIEACDITFCCVSDPLETKKLVFESCGILKGLEGCTPLTKGYVELTGIDPKTSEEIAKEICCKGGRYLEAPVIGSRDEAEDGLLVVAVAGDNELFQSCTSCFSAMSKTAYFVSPQIGQACKMSLVLNMFKGSVFAALGEALTLVNRAKLSMESFLTLLELTPVDLQKFMDKGKSMVKRDYTTNTALSSQQKDLMLALDFADSVKQPLFLAAAVNEVYKRAKLRCYAEHDVSAVIEGIKY